MHSALMGYQVVGMMLCGGYNMYWPQLRYCFGLAKHYSEILPSHIAAILREDEEGNTHKYLQCRQYLQRIMACNDIKEAKIKGNIMFNAHCQSEALQGLKPALSELIIDGGIRNQYELDQVVKWLNREIKVNKDITKQEIERKLARRSEQEREFEEQLEALKRQERRDVNEVCKSMREKYFTIDSKLIYERVSRICKHSAPSKQQPPKKQNKLWDKLLQIKPRRIKQECNSKEIYEQHLKITQNRPRFRFPPQPNGYLHIGHVKSIRVNFQSAIRNGGTCFLRYDDTNPDKQTHEFIQQIEENVRWLGYTPDRVTFASDYFEQLQYFAHRLIQQGNAYVCDSSQEEIEAERKNKQPNPYRQRSIEQSLKIFPNLAYNQTLRLKGVPDHPNPTLRDPIMYRLKNKPHPRTGNKYLIYPMYDFTHCISDSLEHIDYSLCSLEFEVRRELYYTFLDLLGLYKPTVWEYSRLNIEGNVLSKRKIKEFIEKGVVDGWDDPRLLTIRGLKNRGYTPQMLKEFIDKVNCSRSGNENVVQYTLLQKEMKKVLLRDAVKCMAVLEPFRTIITNIPHQSDGLKNELYLERTDVSKLEADALVILKSAGVFRVISKSPQVISLQKLEIDNVAAYRKSNPSIKILHWVAASESQVFPVVTYERLLLSNDQVNPKSKVIYTHARVPLTIFASRSEYMQFERVGFFKFSADGSELRLCAHL